MNTSRFRYRAGNPFISLFWSVVALVLTSAGYAAMTPVSVLHNAPRGVLMGLAFVFACVLTFLFSRVIDWNSVDLEPRRGTEITSDRIQIDPELGGPDVPLSDIDRIEFHRNADHPDTVWLFTHDGTRHRLTVDPSPDFLSACQDLSLDIRDHTPRRFFDWR